MASCPACGSKQGGFLRLCGACKEEQRLLGNLSSKTKHRPIDEPEDDD